MRKAEGLLDLMLFMDQNKIATLTAYLKRDAEFRNVDLIQHLKLNGYITYN